MAYNMTNTEHSGAKKGRGGSWETKRDAKRWSNRTRRINDRKAVAEQR